MILYLAAGKSYPGFISYYRRELQKGGSRDLFRGELLLMSAAEIEVTKKRTGAGRITACALFVALIAVGAFLKIDIPLPLYTMHFTLQWFFVLMAGLLLGKKDGALSVFAYICVGLAGFPVFAAGGGPAYVLRPGFGFLLGFIPAAFLLGFLTEKKKSGYLWKLFAATLAMVVYYSVGAVYFYLIKNLYVGEQVSFGVVVVSYCLITVVPDFILCCLAVTLSSRIKPLVRKI